MAADTGMPRIALARPLDSRADFLALRRSLVSAEDARLDWLRAECELLEGDEIRTPYQAHEFAARALAFGAEALVVHLPVWADPVLTVHLAQRLPLPVLLLGNGRPDSSSLVGLLGAGGALDQIGRQHRRVLAGDQAAGQRKTMAFLRAAAALQRLRGQTLGLFGGRSLGIFTAGADSSLVMKLFGVDIVHYDQLVLREEAENLPGELVQRHLDWLARRTADITYSGSFTPLALERQVRSYLATRRLAEQYELDMLGVQCQPLLSDGYVTQCVAHTLMNGSEDAEGEKPVQVHACESDVDGAISMQILHLLSGGLPAALLDVRWYNPARGAWVLANCGALPAALTGGLENVHMGAHHFGKGGGGALKTQLTPQQVTLARLCRRDGQYWMAVVPAQVEATSPEELSAISPSFPKGLVTCAADAAFLDEFGSNHIHLVAGDWALELQEFCRLAGIPARVWA